MTQDTVLEQATRHRIIPVVAIEGVEAALPLADALIAGGLPVIEVTFRTDAAAAVMRQLRECRPQMTVGAGTVLTLANLQAAKASGAAFAVAPGLNPDIVKAAKDLGLAFIPGVATPSEIERALDLGCKLLKFFPAEALGGIAMLEALVGPYRHTGVQFVPTGGITEANLISYLRIKVVCAIGGTWLAKQDDLAKGNWAQITQRCQAARRLSMESSL